ncbi:MAG TPA: polysaccharide biosynthesis tyrosine autokinase [Chitinophagaceae bacterium]|jgi:capsular exopolysaccharide synthesis family protein|nr:polysaccharide biosynthesis tyrosine autokinase [Chitinophagaceae bacterium]
MEAQLQPQKELSSLSIKDLFFKYIRFLPLFIVSVALALVVAWLYLRYTAPMFSATGSMVIRDEKTSGGQGDRLDELIMADGTKNIQNEIEVLRSRPLMQRVVQALGLNLTYTAKGNIKDQNVYRAAPFYLEIFELADSNAFSLHFNVEGSVIRMVNETQPIRFGQVFKNEHGVFRFNRIPHLSVGPEYEVQWHPTEAVAARLVSRLTVAPKQGTGILVLSLESANPYFSADVINQLIREYQKATVEEKNENTRQALAFIDDRLGKVSREVDSITGRLLAYQQVNNLIDFDAQTSSYLTRVEEVDRQINEQRMQLQVTDMIDEYIRNRQNDFNTVPTTLGLEDPTLAALIASYNQAQLERKSLIDANIPPAHSLVQQKEEQIEKLRQNIRESLRSIRGSFQAVLGNLQQKSGSVQSQIRSLPEKQQNVIEIRRQQESKLAVYNFLSEKREESAIALASTISNTKMLEQATPNLAPVSPRPTNIRMLAVVIGLVLPALFIFVLEISNDKVTTRYDIEKITSATILGEVGHSYSEDTLIVTSTNRSVVAEQFRILRSNLQYVLTNAPKPVVMVTSSFSGEGKSFISTNIGAVMALTGKRTIILEFDIRKPKILSEMNMPKKPGLTNFLLGKSRLEDLPIPVPNYDNLFVLACGPIPPNPSELLLDPRLDDLFVFLKANFDCVIMDTAPVGMVSDAMTLSKYADCTLYILRQGHTYKKQIGLIDELHTQQKLPKISLILNDVKLRSGYGYYGYGRYGYGYGYGSGYFEEETPPPAALSRWFGWMDIKKWTKKKKRKRSNV